MDENEENVTKKEEVTEEYVTQENSYVENHSDGKGMYIASLVLGISAIIVGWIPIIGQILGIIAIIVAVIANEKRKRNNDPAGMTIAGLVCSISGFVLGIILLLVFFFVIGTGIFFYNSAKTTIEDVSTIMSSQDKVLYNTTFEKYEGNAKRGTEVKRLISDVISSNNQFVNEYGKFISIEVDDVIGFYDEDELEDACDTARRNNNQENVSDASAEMRTLSSTISSSEYYKITLEKKDGVVYKIIIDQD